MILLKCFCSVFLVGLFALLSCVSSMAETAKTGKSVWRQFAKNDDFEFSYDTYNITKGKEGGSLIISGYIKTVPLNERAKNSYIMSRKEINQSTTGYEKYSYSQHRFQMDFTNKRAKFTEIKDFNKDGKILDTIKTVHDYSYFPSESIFGLLYKKLTEEMR